VFGFKPPFKIMIAKVLTGIPSLSARDIHQRLLPEYGSEKQCTLESIEHHLQAFKAVGMVKVVRAEMHSDELITHYRLTRSGAEKISKAFPA